MNRLQVWNRNIVYSDLVYKLNPENLNLIFLKKNRYQNICFWYEVEYERKCTSAPTTQRSRSN